MKVVLKDSVDGSNHTKALDTFLNSNITVISTLLESIHMDFLRNLATKT